MPAILVTYLRLDRPPTAPAVSRANAAIAREAMAPAAYLDLYRRVGGPYGWDKRLVMPPETLAAHLAADTTDLYVLRLRRSLVAGSEAAGLCEFDRADRAGAGAGDENGAVELCNFGLDPRHYGNGLGPYLLQTALAELWRRAPATRSVWLHTDEADHPAAIPTYQRAGFRIYDQRRQDPAAL